MMKKVLVLGAEGMLGHTLFRFLAEDNKFEAVATSINAAGAFTWLAPAFASRVQFGVDANEVGRLEKIFSLLRPDFVVNCIGLVKPFQIAKDPASAMNINAQLPHRLALICKASGIKFIQIGSDAVFDGKQGMYTETDQARPLDLYARTKFLGEVSYPNCVTLRTSIIGHELVEKSGLVEWFLLQKTKVNGYTKVIYSGFPTIELARIISDYILPNDKLSGIYHVSSEAISKYDLLKLIARRYGKEIEILPDESVICDRSLDSSVFRALTGYCPPLWEELVDKMYNDYQMHLNK